MHTHAHPAAVFASHPMTMIPQTVHRLCSVRRRVVRATDYGVWAEWRCPLPQMECPLTRKGTRKDGDNNSVYADDRWQGYLFSAS